MVLLDAGNTSWGVEERIDVVDETIGKSSDHFRHEDPSTPAEGAISEIKYVLGDDVRESQLETAAATLSAAPAGWIRLSDVADVRKGNESSEFVLDFQAMRTVTGVAYNAPTGASITPTIESVAAWTGTEFGDPETNSAVSDKHQMHMAERFTERLSVIFDDASGLTADMVRQNATANLPSPPGDLELLVGDLVVWAHPGAVKLDGTTGRFQQTVDIKSELSKALDSGAWPISIVFKSPVPGLLSLNNQITFQRRHTPELTGGTLLINAGQVGEYKEAIPLLAGSATWRIHSVEFTISADLPATRCLPADEPTFSTSAKLLLDADHVIIIRVPPTLRAQFRELVGIQLPLEIGEDGCEIQAVVYRGDQNTPESQSTEVIVQPVQSEQSDDVKWVALDFNKSLDVDDDKEVWVEIAPSRGKAWLGIAEGDTEVTVMRGVAGGPYTSFEAKVDGTEFNVQGLIRVNGIPFQEEDVPVIVPAVLGVTDVFDGITPSKNGITVELAPDSPATQQSGSIDDNALQLQFRVQSPGTYRLSNFSILYTLGQEAAGG
jgi:hypothetical protein